MSERVSEQKLRTAIKEFLDKNIWIDENENILCQWKEGHAFEMSEETRKIIDRIYYEPSSGLVPPKPVKRVNL